MHARHRSTLIALSILAALPCACDRGLDPEYRARIDQRIEQFRKETPDDCTLAEDIRRDLEMYADGKRGWSKADNELLISWKKERDVICEAANSGRPKTPTP